jgi:hypothetical protein
MKRHIAFPVASVMIGLFVATSAFTLDPAKPRTKAGERAAPPSGGSNPTGAGSSTNPSGGLAGTTTFFSDAVGEAMPLLYCRAGEPCDVAVHFTNVGAPLAANQPIPDPVWTVDGQSVAPTSVLRRGGPGWATQAVKNWTARLALSLGNHEVHATIPRLPTEKEVGNNLATCPVTVGQPDMAVKIKKEEVDYKTRYEIKVGVENKGTVPTKALAVLAVLIVNVTHTSTPPTPTQCMGNPNLSGCVVERHTVDSLAPDKKKTWKIGGKQLASTSVRAYAEVRCKDPGTCADQNPDNNTARKTFGP